MSLPPEKRYQVRLKQSTVPVEDGGHEKRVEAKEDECKPKEEEAKPKQPAETEKT